MLINAKKALAILLFGIASTFTYGQDRLIETVSLNVTDTPLGEVLRLIEDQCDYSFAYNPGKIPERALVTHNKEDESLSELLGYLSKHFLLDYEIVEKQIVLSPKAYGGSLMFSLSGFVVDESTGESLIGATIYIDSLNTGTIANGYGFYSIALPYGIHNMSVSYLGYHIDKKKVNMVKNQTHNINLNVEIPQLKEVIIHGDSLINIKQVQTGKMSISPSTIADQPAVFGENDVIKALETIPGINFQSEGSTFFFVRGGNKDQNMVLIDDAPIYNPTHALGLFSSIVPGAVNSVDVYKSDFPISKGGRLSSVIDIKTKEGNKNQFSGWGNIGLVSTQLGIEGPIKKEASSFLISGRLSRVKWFFDNYITGLDDFKFYDLTGKTNFKINNNNKLYFSFYTGSDQFLTSQTGLGWKNHNGSIRWNHIINDNIFVNTTLYGSNYEYLLHLDRSNNIAWRSRIGAIGFKTDFSHFLNGNQELSYGLSINGRTINPGNLTGLENTPQEYLVSVKNNMEIAAYFQHQIMAGKWGFKYGVRVSNWTSMGNSFEFVFDENGEPVNILNYDVGDIYNNYLRLEPRLSASFFVNEKSSLKASYDRSIQNLHLITNTISPFTSFEVWMPSGPNIKPQMSDQLSLTYSHFINNLGVLFELESYFKYMNNQIDYAAHASTLLNPTIESDMVIGTTKSYGIEMVAKKESGRLRGMLGYGYSRSKSRFEKINNGLPFNSISDRPHNLNFVMHYDAGVRVTLSSNFIYSSGLPFSSPTSFYNYNGVEVPYYEIKHNDRFPDYHRLDFSARFQLNKNPESRYKHNLTFSLYNVYSQKNPIFINFNKSITEEGDFVVPVNLIDASRLTTQRYLYQITPALNYQFRF
ncbi:MAG: TonB-dependent receptor [Bacteroidota bacterium]